MRQRYQTAAPASGRRSPAPCGDSRGAPQTAKTAETPAAESVADQSKEVSRIAALSNGVFVIVIS
jgi:hypothetical protein